ncbi:MAG: DUF433 domain-containing protein [Caldilineaceae bacterium]|nr:DUF433 domain-containing protein [Caldilineaceae bacterium]MBP8106966.1 DUF433 domain-containing protein [Caldilineaceae bacterium]MBP8121780.1 DUF433 domain-containing protein [Caldilineaceae bacterium]MBP9072368.1 DUF433 domain-containing protein [Caldilineaceae bacterium]
MWQDRITTNPAIMIGKPVIAGTRLTVMFILDILAQGWSVDEILRNYPNLETDDIRACLAYASEVLSAEKVYSLQAA